MGKTSVGDGPERFGISSTCVKTQGGKTASPPAPWTRPVYFRAGAERKRWQVVHPFPSACRSAAEWQAKHSARPAVQRCGAWQVVQACFR